MNLFEPPHSCCCTENMQRGLLLILSSPSAAGKSTIVRLLREDDQIKLALSISITTRKRRASERNGVDYYFVSEEEFKLRRRNDEFVEWAKVHGNYYATLRRSVDLVLTRGQDMLFDIDYQGAAQLQEKMPKDTVSVFILPPSMKELRERLYRRAEDSLETISMRLKNARIEMQYWKNYDYVIINDDLNNSLLSLKTILSAERLKRYRRPGLASFVKTLTKEIL